MTYSADKMWVSIDSLVFGYDVAEEDIKILLYQRKYEPFAGNWSLIGGFVNERENLADASRRILKEFTGLDDVFLEQLATFGQAERDPGGRVVSILYWSLIKLDDLHRDTTNVHGARWFSINDLPELVIDHKNMVELGVRKLVANARMSPIGFELLAEEFTLPQLKKLYDSIYQRNIDERNFRKKILSTKLLHKLDKKDKSTSRKGAFLDRFDKEKYESLKKDGFLMDFTVK